MALVYFHPGDLSMTETLLLGALVLAALSLILLAVGAVYYFLLWLAARREDTSKDEKIDR